MKLENIVPWGRSMREYKEMFALSKEEIQGRKILGCGDGPSSFNTEAEYEGGEVVSIDPLYAYSKKEIMQRIDEVSDEVMSQVKNNMDKFVWKSIPDIDSLLHIRIEAMMEFLADYDEGKEEGRYIDASLPECLLKTRALTWHSLRTSFSFIASIWMKPFTRLPSMRC